jgi:hypothetical protein
LKQVRNSNEPIWAELDDTSKPTAERRLWVSVIYVAALDARSGDHTLRRDVELWLHSDDFIRVCEFADQDPASVKRNLQRTISAPARVTEMALKTAQREAKVALHEQVIALRRQGHTLNDIAQKTGLSKSGVLKKIRMEGVAPAC